MFQFTTRHVTTIVKVSVELVDALSMSMAFRSLYNYVMSVTRYRRSYWSAPLAHQTPSCRALLQAQLQASFTKMLYFLHILV